MRNCAYYQELISRSLDDELSVEERKNLAVHLASCPSCSQMRQLMADISGLMEEDMEELPDGLHEDIMASVRRSEMIKRNSHAGRTGKTNGRKTIRISRPVRNLLATAACLAIVIAAAVSLNPGERAESVVMSRDAADSSQTAQPQLYGEGDTAPEAEEQAAPSPSPAITPSPSPVTAEIGESGAVYEPEPYAQGTIITTPSPTVDPYSDWRSPMSSGSGDSSNQNRVIINQAPPSPSPAVVTPMPTSAPNTAAEQPHVPAAAEDSQLQVPSDSAPETETGDAEVRQDLQSADESQLQVEGEIHKTAPTRVFSKFPSLTELSPAETIAPDAQLSMENGSLQEQTEEDVSVSPPPSPTPCSEALELNLMEKENGRDLLLMLMGMHDENGEAPDEAELPEGQCDKSYVISLVSDDIPCEVTVIFYGEDIYFSLAEIVIEPSPAAEVPAVQGRPAQETETENPETAETQPAETPELPQTAQEGTQAENKDICEDFEPIWFKSKCSVEDFNAMLESLTK